jgi:acyl-CoA synthetase (AMP-forming)/AMP-acid ligase II
MWRHAQIRTLGDISRYWAREKPDHPAVVGSDGRLTYAALDTRASTIANRLLAGSTGAAARVGYLGRNTVFFWAAWFGAAKAGYTFAPLNWRTAVPELAVLFADAHLAVLFVEADLADRAERALAAASTPPTVVVFDAPDADPRSLASWLNTATASDPALPVDLGAIALLNYTSGTTGRPKGVQITHLAFDRWFMMSSLEPTEVWSSDDIVLMVMPNFHLAGSWLSLPALYHGGTVAVVSSFEPAGVLAALQGERPTVVCLVPTAIDLIVGNPEIQASDFASVRRVLYAGSPIRPGTITRAQELMQCELMQFYGTTETYIICLLRPQQHDLSRPGVLTSCGSPFPFVDVRVVDPGGADVEGTATGEVLVRSPMMFAGYRNAPDATAAALQDGWYRTGDVGRWDAEGNLYLLDRLKDMIISGGENIYSIEVEAALSSHPGVAAVAVIGVPDPTWGERVTAFVVPRAGAALEASDLERHARSLIASYKVPKQILLVEGLPMTASGKIQKNVLREERKVHAIE